MKYLLKLVDGYFEEVDQYTFDNRQYAIADDGVSPRYTEDDWVCFNEDGTITVHLYNSPGVNLSILQRALSLQVSPQSVPGGFVREPTMIKFLKGKTMTMLELKTGIKFQRREKAA